jgi:Chalcone isomerase-like
MCRYARLVTFAITLSIPVVLAAPVLGAECIGVQVPDSVKAGDTDLVLNGLGIRKATLLKVKVYVAGLYLPQKSGDAGKILGTDQPWQLSLHFVRDVDASDIRDAFDEGFKKATGGKIEALSKRIETLNAQMVDFKEGQHLAYTYEPATGTVVDANGKIGGAIEGADFATTLLKISIGPEPPNEDLKAGLLGGKCE